MTLWVDQYRPRAFNELHYHKSLSTRLECLSATADFPHTLFYGPSGAGKKTRIRCTLRQIFGASAEKIKIEQRIFWISSNRKMEVNIIRSSYHLEITPSDAGTYDRLVIQEIIKETAQTQQVDLNAKQRFKVVVVHEAESLSRDAQAALRRTMEKYASNLRIILCANSTSQLIAPIRSRCLLIRVAAPKPEEMSCVLNHVASRVGFALPEEAARNIVEYSNGNMRKAIMVMEDLKRRIPDLKGRLYVAKPDWEGCCHRIADMIIAEQSPAQVMAVRTSLYNLLSHCIQPTTLLKTVAERLVDKVDESIKADVVHWTAFYEVRLKIGNKKIFHLEAWVVKVMTLYKKNNG